jgi:hypothetical protein
MTMISATYSPEDNKLRLYATSRLDAETYARVKEAGFQWAPKQDLFVAPKWTPAREDLALELAGEIDPEETTIAERAVIKAERLEAMAGRKLQQAGAYQRAAEELSQAFYMGQPILVGHHSERKARKTKERMESASNKAITLSNASNYWLYRATGVERFANMKGNARVRAGRIKTLLAELRDLQRRLNESHKRLETWEAAKSDDAIRWLVSNTNYASFGTYSDLEQGKIDPQTAREKQIAGCRAVIASDYLKRWIDHVLNRLAFEREMLGDVARYDGELTAVILQAFAREHGTDKPAAKRNDPESFELESPVPLPFHLGAGGRCYLDLSDDDWRDLMQSVGYDVPEKKERRASAKPAPAPLINPTPEHAERLQALWNMHERMAGKSAGNEGRAKPNAVKSVSQALYSNNSGGSYSPFETVEISEDGRRIWQGRSYIKVTPAPLPAVARIRIYSGGSEFYKPMSIVHISDKPAKALPIDFDAVEAATARKLDNIGRPATLGGKPYDPALLSISRVIESTSQGSATLRYDGRLVGKYGDMIRRTDAGQYEGHGDDYWHDRAHAALAQAEGIAA